MSIAEQGDYYPVEAGTEVPALRAVETIQMPDGTLQPSYPLVLKGLEESLKSGGIDESRFAEMYGAWDPNYNIRRHLKQIGQQPRTP